MPKSKCYERLKRIAYLKAKKEREHHEQRDASQGLSPWFLQAMQSGAIPNPNGTVVDPNSVLGIPAFYHGTNLIATTLASFDRRVFRRLPNGGKVYEPDHPINDVINARTHLITNRFKLMQALVCQTIRTGAGYLEIERNKSKQPIRLHLHMSLNVKIKPDVPTGDNTPMYYELVKEKRKIMPEDMIHLACLSADGVSGLSPVRAANVALGNAIEANLQFGGLMQNGMVAPGFFQPEHKIRPDDLTTFRKTLQELYGGSRNAAKTPVLDMGWKYVQMGMSPVDAGIITYLNYSVADVGRLLGIPLSLMMVEGGTNAKSASEEQNQQFINMCLRGWATNIEAEFDRKLIAPSQYGDFFIQLDLEGLFRGDMAVRTNNVNTLVRISAMDVDEARASFGMNPIGDKTRYIEGNNMIPVNKPAPVVEQEPDEAPDLELFNAVNNVASDSIGRALRAGWKAQRRLKEPEKRAEAITKLRAYCADNLASLIPLVNQINPALTLDALITQIVEGVETSVKEGELTDLTRSITAKALGQ
jgi:HK97 family phage portal protein